MTAPVPRKLNLVVSDMGATVDFYRRLGVNIPDSEPDWQNHHRSAVVDNGISLDFDSQQFARHWDVGWHGGMGVLSFMVDTREEVDQIFGDLTGAGHKAQQAPYDAFWGSRYAVVEDPDGNAVGIMSPRDTSMGSDPDFP